MNHRNTITKSTLAIVTIVLISLQPAVAGSCSLSITSIPEVASASIDGGQPEITPATLSLPCGNHSVDVVKAGYEPYHREVYLTPGVKGHVVANLEYRSNRNSVIIRSEPPGGSLYIDGIFRGMTPVHADNLVFGRHSVMIVKTGYQKYYDVVSAGPGDVPEYTEYLVPEPQTGFIGIESSPDSADVFLDGRPAGTTPTHLKRVSAGNHSILLQKNGYENYRADVTVPGGGSILVQPRLLPVMMTGTVVIDSTPQGAGIFLNGALKSFTPAVLENIPQGTYLLEFRKPGFPDIMQNLTLNGGETREMFIELVRTTGSAENNGPVYLQRSNASQLLPGLTGSTPVFEPNYTWYNNGHEATVRLRIPKDLYDHYNTSAPHDRGVANISRYAITDKDRQYLHDLTGVLKDAGESKTYSARNDYRNVLAFVQAIRYTEDLEPGSRNKSDYWQYPVETLVRGEGDCEDHAILAAALLKEMEYDVALVLLDDQTKGHAAVAIACDRCNGYYYAVGGKKYYFLETTSYGSSPGIMDPYYEKVGADVIVL